MAVPGENYHFFRSPGSSDSYIPDRSMAWEVVLRSSIQSSYSPRGSAIVATFDWSSIVLPPSHHRHDLLFVADGQEDRPLVHQPATLCK